MKKEILSTPIERFKTIKDYDFKDKYVEDLKHYENTLLDNF